MLTAQTPSDPMRNVAERYVRLVLAVGQHDADYVDAFYGPAEWRKAAEAEKLPLAAIDQQAEGLEKDLAAEKPDLVATAKDAMAKANRPSEKWKFPLPKTK